MGPPPRKAGASLPSPRRLYSDLVNDLEQNAARRALITGGALALVVFLIPFLRFVFHTLITLVHELGHAATAWAFGIPSIPAFDFVYGGGVTMHQGRSTGLMILIYLGFLGVAYWVREDRGYLIALAVWVCVYTLVAFTQIHEAIEIAMGHGSELIFAGIFLYRALTGYACRTPGERPAYAFCACFILLSDAAFAMSLLRSAANVADYEDAKGGGHWMDFSRLAEDYLHIDLRAVVFLFLFAVVLVPFAAYLLSTRAADQSEPARSASESA
jgi:hypothetical protein